MCQLVLALAAVEKTLNPILLISFTNSILTAGPPLFPWDRFYLSYAIKLNMSNPRGYQRLFSDRSTFMCTLQFVT